eukprot:1250537-Pyramimonas_sp.AAC.1
MTAAEDLIPYAGAGPGERAEQEAGEDGLAAAALPNEGGDFDDWTETAYAASRTFPRSTSTHQRSEEREGLLSG